MPELVSALVRVETPGEHRKSLPEEATPPSVLQSPPVVWKMTGLTKTPNECPLAPSTGAR
jgi:hypothetical protein